MRGIDPGQPGSFGGLIELIRGRLLPGLWSKWGSEVGGDVGCEVEEYAWENRDRLLRMSNPLGFLYRVSQSKARRYSRWSTRTTFPSRCPDRSQDDRQLPNPC